MPTDMDEPEQHRHHPVSVSLSDLPKVSSSPKCEDVTSCLACQPHHTPNLSNESDMSGKYSSTMAVTSVVLRAASALTVLEVHGFSLLIHCGALRDVSHLGNDRQTNALIAMMSSVTKKSCLPGTAAKAHGLR